MNIDKILSLVTRPARYLGNETNARHRSWEETELHMALVFPDLYEIGMSHLGLHILYDIINQTRWAMADRAYCPDPDMEQLLREKGVPLWGLESRKPLRDFDILAITLPYELCYANILTVLDLSGIPLTARERMDRRWPLILGGGTCAVNPEPVADIFDAILVGEGEEALLDIAQTVREWQEGKGSKTELWERLGTIPGVYVPRFYQPGYLGRDFAGIEITAPATGPVVRRTVHDFDRVPAPSRPLVPLVNIVHDRLGAEIARGCTRGCRFCQAGVIYRPVRERRPGTILEYFRGALSSSGWDQISLLSLSTGDYRNLMSLMTALMDRYVVENISISLPSLRVGSLTPEVMTQLQRVRKTGLTLAPEAGTDRLRQVINKGITEEDLLSTAAEGYRHGWSNMKLYFMIGLPTETLEDVEAIAGLGKKVLATGKKGRRPVKVTLSVGTFVPKPHTAFQWERQISIEESRERLAIIRSNMRGRAMQLRWHDPRQSCLEGIFSRGDRRLFKVLHRAWSRGARLDAWGDHLNLHLYREAAAETGIDLDRYLEEIPMDAPLPWGHIHTGVSLEYLRAERQKSRERVYTPDCRTGACQGCGVCDFKETRPVTFSPEDSSIPHGKGRGKTPADKNAHNADGQTGTFFYEISYSKLGEGRFLGHLDMVNLFQRAFRRAGIPLCFSHGFHPKPKFSFPPPIPLGMESLRETFRACLERHVSPNLVTESLNRQLPKGIQVHDALFVSGGKTKTPQPLCSTFLVGMPGLDETRLLQAIETFHSRATWEIKKKTRGKNRGEKVQKEVQIDLKQAIGKLQCLNASGLSREYPALTRWFDTVSQDRNMPLDAVLLINISRGQGVSVRPAEAVGTLLGLNPEEEALLRVLKSEESLLDAFSSTPPAASA